MQCKVVKHKIREVSQKACKCREKKKKMKRHKINREINPENEQEAQDKT